MDARQKRSRAAAQATGKTKSQVEADFYRYMSDLRIHKYMLAFADFLETVVNFEFSLSVFIFNTVIYVFLLLCLCILLVRLHAFIVPDGTLRLP
jgi:hypothetical protein